MFTLEHLVWGIVVTALVWTLIAMVVFWRKPFLRWWRIGRRRRKSLVQLYDALQEDRANKKHIIKDAKLLPSSLRQQWFAERAQPPLEQLRNISGVGDGTLDLLRRSGVERVGQLKDASKLTDIKGIGAHKAKLLIEGQSSILASWQMELEQQYAEVVLPTEHQPQIDAAEQDAQLAQERLDAYALVDIRGARRLMLRGRLLPYLLSPVEEDAWDEMEARLLQAQAALDMRHTARLTHRINTPLNSALDGLVHQMTQQLGSTQDVWLHVLRKHYSPTEFEVFVAQLWRAQGYEVELTPASGDHGADLIATKAEERVAIECKRYAEDGSVGNAFVRGVAAHKIDQENPATHAMLVTTGRFTQKAVEAGEKFGVTLFGPEMLADLMQRTGIVPDLSRMQT